MRRFVVSLALLLAFASSASAAPKYVGSWYAGDNVRALRMDVRDDRGLSWGSVAGTGYTPTMEVRRPNDSTVYAILEGAWEDNTETAAVFFPGMCCYLVPTATNPVTANGFADYEGVLVLTRGSQVTRLGSDGQSSPFTFRIKAWP